MNRSVDPSAVVSPVVGIILAGGEGSRLGGADKAMLTLEGRPFLARVIAAVEPSVEEIVVVAAAGQRVDPVVCGAGVPLRVVRDTIDGGGPLAALADGLRGARPSRDAIAVVASCDVPRLSPAVVRLLVESLLAEGASCDWAVPEVGGHPQVLVSAIRTTTLPAVESHLASGRRDVRGLLAKVRACMIDEQRLRRVDPGLASFRDVDTADDLQTLGE